MRSTSSRQSGRAGQALRKISATSRGKAASLAGLTRGARCEALIRTPRVRWRAQVVSSGRGGSLLPNSTQRVDVGAGDSSRGLRYAGPWALEIEDPRPLTRAERVTGRVDVPSRYRKNPLSDTTRRLEITPVSTLSP